MSILTPSGLETVTYSQQGWNAIVNANFEKINDHWDEGGGGCLFARDVVGAPYLYPATDGDHVRIKAPGSLQFGTDVLSYDAEYNLTHDMMKITSYGGTPRGWHFNLYGGIGGNDSGILLTQYTNDLYTTILAMGWKTDNPNLVGEGDIISRLELGYVGNGEEAANAIDSYASIKTTAAEVGGWTNDARSTAVDFYNTWGDATPHAALSLYGDIVMRPRSYGLGAWGDYPISFSGAAYTGTHIEPTYALNIHKSLNAFVNDFGASGEKGVVATGCRSIDSDATLNWWQFFSGSSSGVWDRTHPKLFMILTGLTTKSAYGLVYADDSSVVLLSNGGDLSNTIGTAGKLNIYVQSSRVFIQNKLGSNTRVYIWFLGQHVA